MHKVIHLLISSLLLFPLFSFSLPGSRTDTTGTTIKKDSTIVTYFNNDFEKLGSLKLHPTDTSITGFQNYSPLLKQSNFFASLGNNGHDHRYLLPYPFFNPSGFNYGVHTFDRYLYQNDSVKYYKVIKTFTELEYVQGAKKEIFFHATFSRNVYRSLNIGFDLRVLNSPGAYLRQNANHINFVVTSQYFSKNKRYGVIANFLVNRLKNYENGGIKYDSIFEQDLESNRQIYETRLKKAQNRIRESGFFMKHYFNLSRHAKNSKDTSNFTELGRLSYSFEYNRQIQNYIDYDANSGFYRNIYLDSISTYDSLTIKRITNDICWSNPSFRPDKRPRLLQLEFHLKQNYIEFSDRQVKKYFLQYIPSADLYLNILNSLKLNVHADYVLGDYNEGDLAFKVGLSQTLGGARKNGGVITLTGLMMRQKPGWFTEHFYGNNFRWDTSWVQQNILSGSFAYAYKGFVDAGVSISRLNHFVYLDTAATPKQFNNEFGHMQVWLNGNLQLWRFKFIGRFAYQTIQGTTVLRLPGFLGNFTLCYDQDLFHGASTIEPGINFNYQSLYYGDSYMPATRSFFIQDEKQVGNYIYMDFFVNVKVQRARLFLIYSHFNSSFMGFDYYTVPHYPMQDAAFKFGVTWRFFD